MYTTLHDQQSAPQNMPTYLALTPSKGKEVAKPEKEIYMFDIDQIFLLPSER